MAIKYDLTGQKINRLLVLCRVKIDGNKKTLWKCRCDCGKEIIVESHKLRTGLTKSCGCYRGEFVKYINKTHGMAYTRINKIYRGMKCRCYTKSNSRYADYGGRGITICDEWLGKDGFQHFYEWAMNNGYTDELTIDRIDVDQNYTPENCRWITMAEQGDNKRCSTKVSAFNETHSIAEWSRRTGVNYKTLYRRIIKDGWNPEKALTDHNDERYTKNGRNLK